MQNQKRLLKELNRFVISNLAERRITLPFRVAKNQSPEQTNTQGWGIKVGVISGFGCSAEIWLDKFSAHSNRKIWYGITTKNNNKKFQSIIRLANKKFGRPMKISVNNIGTYNNIISLSEKLAKNQFGKPVLEEHDRYSHYYGVYEIDNVGFRKNLLDRMSLRIADFFYDIIEMLLKTSEKGNEDYPYIENRKKVTSHLQRERRSHVATLRKQMDDYICSICDFSFKERYGPLGNNFAEAHHIVPLSSHNHVRITKVVDLITVCSNCHRMLHRMSGNNTDVARLRKIVRKSE